MHDPPPSPRALVLVVLVDDVREFDADRGPSSAVVEKFTAVRCARADRRRDYANLVSKLQPRGCNCVPVVRELPPVVRFDSDDVRELSPEVKLLSDDRGNLGSRRWEHAADV
jgi:hypothetical protein